MYSTHVLTRENIKSAFRPRRSLVKGFTLNTASILSSLLLSFLYSNTACAQAALIQSTAFLSAEETLDSGNIDEVIVFGRGEKLIGIAGAASEGSVGGDDLLVRPMLRVADLLEAVPGMIAAQHSGSGKANQYFLRGFNLDHGTDFTTYIDDVPWNLRTHGHGQGYLDVNGLIPETVERVDYRKGPYRASSGDFSLAGSGHFKSIDGLGAPFVAVEAGSYGWGRVAGGGTTELGDGNLTLLGQYKTYDGPWELPENLQHESVWGKYSEATSYGTWNLSLSGYVATWHPTEQTPESAFGSDKCKDEFCSLDPSAYGKTNRWILTSNWLGDDWRASFYSQYYDWHMLSNATYEDDGQINQFDRRTTFGGRLEKTFFKTADWDLLIGSEFRYDNISKVGLDSTKAGEFISNISNNAVDESSLGVYAEANWHPWEKLRLTAGARTDFYNSRVGAKASSGDTKNVGNSTDSITLPKLGAAYALTDQIEFYGNWGQGFHSNDARGVVNKEVSVPPLVRGSGYETGVRFEQGNFKISAAYWWLNVSSELIFVGDSNSVEPKGGAKRNGYELVAFWRPLDWLGIDAVYTGSHARNVDPEASGGKYVEGAVENAGELGIAATKAGWELSARLRYLGAYPLVPDNSERAEAETMLNLRLAREFEKFTLYGEVLNLLDHKGKDIVYFYENAFDAEGGRVSRAEEPRSVRVGLKYSF